MYTNWTRPIGEAAPPPPAPPLPPHLGSPRHGHRPHHEIIIDAIEVVLANQREADAMLERLSRELGDIKQRLMHNG